MGKRWAAISLFVGAVILCPTVLAAEKAQTRTVIDETGRAVRVPARIERIVSLAPSLTEIVYALGLEKRLVGVTNQCDFPRAARRKPKVGDVINPSVEKILELKPDVVLGTTAGNRRETVQALERLGVPLYGIAPRTVEDIFASIRHLAELAGVPQAGEELAARLRARLAALEARLGTSERPAVLFILWLEPLLTAGGDTFLNDVLRRAGAEAVTADLPQSWPRLSLEEVIERDPDYLVLPRTHSLQARLARLVHREPWRGLRAVKQQRVVWLDDPVLRPGPRIVDAIEELARALHPEAFPPEEAARK
ncbi:MAG: ABC transporter substrate-binding protein [Terriglobia bacterium]